MSSLKSGFLDSKRSLRVTERWCPTPSSASSGDLNSSSMSLAVQTDTTSFSARATGSTSDSILLCLSSISPSLGSRPSTSTMFAETLERNASECFRLLAGHKPSLPP